MSAYFQLYSIKFGQYHVVECVFGGWSLAVVAIICRFQLEWAVRIPAKLCFRLPRLDARPATCGSIVIGERLT